MARLFIIFNNLNIGGIERKIIDISHHYSSQHQIYLLLKKKQGLLLSCLPTNIKILSPLPLPKPINNLFFPFWIGYNIVKFNPKLIITYGNFCAICSIIGNLLSHSLLIISEDSSVDVQLNTDTYSFIRRLLVKKLYPLATNIIVLTPTAQNKLQKFIPKLKNKITILPNWLPYSNSIISKTKIKKDIDILFLGRFEPQKNPLRFLKICRQLIISQPLLKIAMVGEGSLQSKIIKYLEKYQLSKNIQIYPATTEVETYYRRSKVFLMTSNHEGFPLTILESLSNGCPVVCPRLPELISFFNFNSGKFLYLNDRQAVKNILYMFTHPTNCNYYQKKIFKSQYQNFQSTINHLNQYL